jgi:site-specific DNA-adenine methylase
MESAPTFAWQGSKASIRNWVLQHMPTSGRWYLEPFAGRGNIFFLAQQKLDFQKWFINDKNTGQFFNDLTTFNSKQLPDNIDNFKDYKYKDDPISRILEPQISYLGSWRSGFKGKYKPNWKYDKSLYARKLDQAQQQLQNAVVSAKEWYELPYHSFKSVDFIYFDPPYRSTDNRSYDDIDHERLIKTLKGLKARWLLSHSYDDLYIRHLGGPINMLDRAATLKSGFGKSGSRLVECLWKGNY